MFSEPYSSVCGKARGGGGGGERKVVSWVYKKAVYWYIFFTIDVKIRGVAPIRNFESMNCNFFCYVR